MKCFQQSAYCLIMTSAHSPYLTQLWPTCYAVHTMFCKICPSTLEIVSFSDINRIPSLAYANIPTGQQNLNSNLQTLSMLLLASALFSNTRNAWTELGELLWNGRHHWNAMSVRHFLSMVGKPVCVQYHHRFNHALFQVQSLSRTWLALYFEERLQS